MNKKILIGIIALAIIIGVLVLIGTNTTGLFGLANENKVLKIGLIAPLTGDGASYGEDALKALDIAKKELLERKINVEFFVEDGKCNGKDAAIAAQTLIATKKPDAIIAMCSSEVLGVAPIAEETKTLLIASVATNPKISEAGDYIFRTNFSDIYQARIAAEIAIRKYNAKTAGIIYIQSDFQKGLRDELIPNFEKLGGKIIFEDAVAQGSNDFKLSIEKMNLKNPDVLFVFAYNSEYKIFFKQYLESGTKIPIIGADPLSDPTIYSEKYLQNYPVKILFPFQKELWKNSLFENKFKSIYGREPQAYAPYIYDSVMLLVDSSLKINSTDSTKLKNYLYTTNYDGVTGKITFDSNGDRKNIEFNILELIYGETKVVEYIN